MPREDTQFKKGNPGGKGGGRKAIPPEYKDLFAKSPAQLAEMLKKEDLKDDLRVKILMWMSEMVYGKPQQQVDMTADIGDDTKKALTERMTLDECKAIIEQFKA